jgi:Tfp pilus assembly protein PilZ
VLLGGDDMAGLEALPDEGVLALGGEVEGEVLALGGALEELAPAGADPFAAGKDPFASGVDPFALGADPFSVDPFASGPDPFAAEPASARTGDADADALWEMPADDDSPAAPPLPAPPPEAAPPPVGPAPQIAAPPMLPPPVPTYRTPPRAAPPRPRFSDPDRVSDPSSTQPFLRPPAAAPDDAGAVRRKRPARLKITYPRMEQLLAELRDNVRRGGCFVKNDKPLSVGRDCEIEVRAPGLDEPLVIPGVVTWSSADMGSLAPGQSPGMGIEYRLDDAGRAAVERALGGMRPGG